MRRHTGMDRIVTGWCEDGRHHVCRGVLGAALESTTPCMCSCGCYRRRVERKKEDAGMVRGVQR